MFKRWPIAQAFCSKSANFRPLRIHPKSIQTVRKQSQISLERFCRHSREFGAISRTWQNRACSKSWAVAQAFCSKSANFRPLRIHPKSTQTVAQAVTNHFRTVLQAFQRVWSDSLDWPKSAMFKPWAIAQAFCSKSANFRHFRIHPKLTQTSAQALTNHFRTVLQAFQRVWSDFRDLPKSAMFKPWAIAQGFCSKSANFRPFRIHPKSTQKFAQGVTNHFRTVLEAFQRVWSDFQDLPKWAMFKPMRYSSGILLKIGQFPTFTNFTLNRHKQSRKQSQIILERFWLVPESLERFPGLAKIGHLQTMGYSPGFLLKIGQFSTLSNSP